MNQAGEPIKETSANKVKLGETHYRTEQQLHDTGAHVLLIQLFCLQAGVVILFLQISCNAVFRSV